MANDKKTHTSKMTIVLHCLYFMLLLYNVAAAKIVPSLVALCLFLLTSPIFFRKFKAKHHKIVKTLTIILILPVLAFLIFSFMPLMTGSVNWIEETIPTEEQAYIDTILSQITSEYSKDEAIALLGKPDRDLIYKVNWWVRIDNRNSRVGIYFSPTTGKANKIILDGGIGSFYYQKKVEPVSP